MTEAAKFVGRWRKMASPACARDYPAELTIEANGLYRGAPASGQYTTWDVGTWKVEDAEVVSISTANDAVLRYAFTLTGATLTFVDAENCTFSYQREG